MIITQSNCIKTILTILSVAQLSGIPANLFCFAISFTWGEATFWKD